MNHFAEAEADRILVIPDRQMANFMSVYTRNDSRISLLEYTDFIAKPGKRVRITQGDFENTIGTIKRIKKNQCIVVQLEGFTALAIAFVPPPGSKNSPNPIIKPSWRLKSPDHNRSGLFYYLIEAIESLIQRLKVPILIDDIKTRTITRRIQVTMTYYQCFWELLM